MAENIFIHDPLPQKELHGELCKYDVGLALEPGKDHNNELLVSNKLLAYLQSGLYILATNTAAQKSILEKHPKSGICFDLKRNDSGIFLNTILNNLSSIRENFAARFEVNKNNNWERECGKLLRTWNDGK